MTPDDIRRLADDRKTGFIDWYSKATQALRALADVVEAGNSEDGDAERRAALARVEALKP